MDRASVVTGLLRAWGDGDLHARDDLLPLVYDELRKLAAAKLVQEKPGQTLQPTALVHEAYLRLVGQQRVAWQNRAACRPRVGRRVNELSSRWRASLVRDGLSSANTPGSPVIRVRGIAISPSR